MGMYDSVWFKNAQGEDVEIQFKSGERTLATYELGQDIPVPDGVHFAYEGCFVVSSGKIVAVFASERTFIFDKWGGSVAYPNIDDAHPFKGMLKNK